MQRGDVRAGKSDALSDEIRIYVAAASTATETAWIFYNNSDEPRISRMYVARSYLWDIYNCKNIPIKSPFSDETSIT